MKKWIHRVLNFSPEEIKDALLDKMRDWDEPCPKGDVGEEFEFHLTKDGARISWKTGIEGP